MTDHFEDCSNELDILRKKALSILPRATVLEGTRTDYCLSGLLPAEAPLIANAVEKRKREFTAGRVCARRALARLGHDQQALLYGNGREPLWPPETVGSITHDEGYCLVAVHSSNNLRGLGIDLTGKQSLDTSLVRLICNDEECQAIANAPNPVGIDSHKIIFSLKESLFKCLYPVLGQMFDFHDATVELDMTSSEARFRLHQGLPADWWQHLFGRYCVVSDCIFSCVWLE